MKPRCDQLAKGIPAATALFAWELGGELDVTGGTVIPTSGDSSSIQNNGVIDLNGGAIDPDANNNVTIAPDGNGGFTVSGSHMYTASGTPAITVTINGPDNRSTAAIACQPWTITSPRPPETIFTGR